jgi:hypothetical protein
MVKNASLFLLYLLLSWPMAATCQKLKFYSVRRLPSAVNSAGEESLPLLAPGGRELYFTRSLYAGNRGGKFSGMDIWLSEASTSGWVNATNAIASKINNDGHNALVGMSGTGDMRYFVSLQPNERFTGIYVTRRTGSRWSLPEFVPVPGVDNREFLGIYVSPDFDVILLSMKGADSRGEEDLYFSIKDSAGRWSVPKNMGATLNTTGFEISPFLSADKKKLYFASNGHKGAGDADIFSSERLYNSWETWSVPVNLGKEVNSKKFDAYFSIYGDSIAYFASNRDGELADLYEVKVAKERTVLADGQHYLSRDEWDRVLGGKVSDQLSFSSGSTQLSPSTKELLFFIANKLQLQRDIFVHLVVKEEESPAKSAERLKAISETLTASGIGKERILTEQVEPAEKAGQGKIEVRLIE